MNMRKANILTTIIKNPCTNQRALAALTGYSLGMINKTVKELMADGYLNEATATYRDPSDGFGR